MAKRPSIDLASLTDEAAEPMQEASQRVANLVPAPTDVAAVLPAKSNAAPAKTADLQQLAFKVSPAFRKRFRRRAHDADLKLNELLFQALDAWEEKQGIR